MRFLKLGSNSFQAVVQIMFPCGFYTITSLQERFFRIVLYRILLILLNIMFHALMGRFQLELFIFITYFFTVIPLTSC